MFSFVSKYFSTDLASTRHGQHADLRSRQGRRPRRTLRSSLSARKAAPAARRPSRPSASVAKQMLGRTPGNITAIRPMKDGVIADFTITEQMLKYHQEDPRQPAGSAEAAHRDLRAARLDAGRAARDQGAPSAPAPRRYPDEEPMAAAIGVDLPIADAIGSMVVDIGRHHGGRRDLARRHRLLWPPCVGGDKFDEAIINYIRRNYGMLYRRVDGRADQADRLGLPRRRGARDGGEGPQPRRRYPLIVHDLVQRDPRSPHLPPIPSSRP